LIQDAYRKDGTAFLIKCILEDGVIESAAGLDALKIDDAAFDAIDDAWTDSDEA
jgi:hypothetical protein